VIKGREIEDMIEYVETGLIELSNNIAWKQQFLNENDGIDEMKLLDNMKTIKEEYIDLLSFLKK
jgi:hypothetical protein